MVRMRAKLVQGNMSVVLTLIHTKNECHFPEPFPKRQILDSSKLKEFADDNFRFDGNGRKFFKWEENTVEYHAITPVIYSYLM